MSRRLTASLFVALLTALVAATAAAQTPPPDEHVAARAFADITMQATRELEATAEAVDFEWPRCKAERRLARGPVRAQSRFAVFAEMQGLAQYARALEPLLTRTVAALDGVPTADHVLRDGRRAWRRVQGVYGRLAALPHVRVCPVMRNFVRDDFTPTREMRRAARLYGVFGQWDTTRIEDAWDAAEARLVELGVPVEDADTFDGEVQTDDKPVGDAGSRDSPAGTARVAAQVPAPSSPLTPLRAAR